MLKKKKFVLHSPLTDLDSFQDLAAQATRLKPFGHVEINVSTLAARSEYELPGNGSPWHEYAVRNPCPYKFFPHEKIAPFIPVQFVEKNRDLLLRKVEILRELGLGAAFWSYEPNFLPEAFFEAYPHLRGPRIDHPRRSCKEEFAPCVDQEETLQMFREMVAELVRNVDILGTYFFKTNDAGPGLCWSDWLYSGPNGPTHCKHRSMGQRATGLLEAIRLGGCDAGKNLEIHMSGLFTKGEADDIQSKLPENCFLRGAGNLNNISVASLVDELYPVQGLFDAMGILENLQSISENTRSVFIDFRSAYDRGAERLDTSEKVFELIERHFTDKPQGKIPLLQSLRDQCEKWTDEEQAEKLFVAFTDLHETLMLKKLGLGRINMMYTAISNRFINRPLLAVPERLPKAEEEYFLPYVFNISENEARTDFADVHGGRFELKSGIVAEIESRLISIAKTMESIHAPSSNGLFSRMGIAIRIYASLLRSTRNFHDVQVIRDRKKKEFSQIALPPEKKGNWSGCKDLHALNAIMRDELDNAQDLIDLLSGGGMELFCHAATSDLEDTFLIGPDIIEQIKKKRRLMRHHWLDAADYLPTPMK